MKLRYKLLLLIPLLTIAFFSLLALLALICYPKPYIEKLDCFAERIELAGVKRAARVTENLYRGAQPTSEGLVSLKALGIKTVLDLHAVYKEDDYPAQVKASGFNYIAMPLTGATSCDENIEEFLSIVTSPRNCPVFVHCRRGKVRSGVMLALYRMHREGWKNEDAFNEMLYFGFSIFHRETFFFGSREVHTELAAFVREYRPPAKSGP